MALMSVELRELLRGVPDGKVQLDVDGTTYPVHIVEVRHCAIHDETDVTLVAQTKEVEED